MIPEPSGGKQLEQACHIEKKWRESGVTTVMRRPWIGQQ
jgi:hypothetical protein